MPTVTIVCLRLFIPLGGKNCHVEIYGQCEQIFFFFLISEMEGRRIRNQKNIISEALHVVQEFLLWNQTGPKFGLCVTFTLWYKCTNFWVK
jgi:hypothetical protein